MYVNSLTRALVFFTVAAYSVGAVIDDNQIKSTEVDEIVDKLTLEKLRILTPGHHLKSPMPTSCSCKCHNTTPHPWTTTTRKPITSSTHRPITTTTRKPITTSTHRPITTTTRKPITTTTHRPITTTTRKPTTTSTTSKPVITTTRKPGHCHCPVCPIITTPKPTHKPCVCPCPVTTPKPTLKPCHCHCRTPIATPVLPKPCVGDYCCPIENSVLPIYISHPTNSKIFYQCSWGFAYVFYCPNDTVFNKDLNICVYQD